MISYAQNFEDVMLHRVFAGQGSGFYIDVGAMDPVEDSVTKAFYDRGWSGINIEPVAQFHSKLVEARSRDTNLNVALGEKEEVKAFYAFENLGVSTFSDRFRDYFAGQGYRWVEQSCRVETLASVCRRHVSGPIDFLKVDAEGWEGPTLRGGDWVSYRPVVLVIEAIEPYSHQPAWQEWEPLVVGPWGYRFVYFDGLNRFYVREEDRALESRFACPPNVFDGFELHAAVSARSRAEQLAQEVEALRDQIINMKRRAASLEEQLQENRHWVGRLSEALAALKSK